MASAATSISSSWVKLVFNETPQKAVVKQGYLFDEGDFYRIVGDTSETYVRKGNVISITKKRNNSRTKRGAKK